jgi:hypothetical protein
MGKCPEYFFFEYSSPVEANECTAKQLVNLIFSLSLTYSLIKLNYVVIYGNLATRGDGTTT